VQLPQARWWRDDRAALDLPAASDGLGRATAAVEPARAVAGGADRASAPGEERGAHHLPASAGGLEVATPATGSEGRACGALQLPPQLQPEGAPAGDRCGQRGVVDGSQLRGALPQLPLGVGGRSHGGLCSCDCGCSDRRPRLNQQTGAEMRKRSTDVDPPDAHPGRFSMPSTYPADVATMGRSDVFNPKEFALL
jgi:hypothetical protein